LFVIELSGGRIHSMNTDGSNRKTIVTDCRNPDGIVVDTEASHIYWTNMGIPSLNDGSIDEWISMGRIARCRISGGTSRRSRFISIRKTASYIGVIGRECA